LTPWAGAPWTPRKWQADALAPTLDAIRSDRRSVVSAVMGSGKSILIAEIAYQIAAENPDGVVVISVPTVRLVEQTAATLEKRFGPDQIGQFYTAKKEWAFPVVVACNPSVCNLAETLQRAMVPVTLWIADEVHRSQAPELIEASTLLAPKHAVGLSATPFRSDEKERLELWDSVAYRYPPGDALKDGVIVPFRVIPWDGAGGDRPLDDVCIDMIKAHTAGSGAGLINATDIADAEAFVEKLTEAGIRAEAVHSKRLAASNNDTIARLEAGDLDAVVHVNQLSEGVDFPWLSWACLRRPVTARVRFVQEVGRMIRASEGKRYATFLDPHDLFGSFGLVYEEALGWVEPEPEPEDVPELQPDDDDFERATIERILYRRLAATDPITAYCRRLLLVLQSEGLVDSDKVQSASWRRYRASDRQAATLAKRAKPIAHRLPDPHGNIAEILCGLGELLTKGAASDLLEVCFAMGRIGADGWPAHQEVDPPPPAALEEIKAGKVPGNDDPRWYCYAVTMTKKGVVALAVVHGGRVVAKAARAHVATDHMGAMEIHAIAAACRRGAGEIVVSSEWARRFAVQESKPKNPAIAKALMRLPRIDPRAVTVVPADVNPARPVAMREAYQWLKRKGGEA